MRQVNFFDLPFFINKIKDYQITRFSDHKIISPSVNNLLLFYSTVLNIEIIRLSFHLILTEKKADVITGFNLNLKRFESMCS